MEYFPYIIAILASAFAGALNTLAGFGSAITLTVLTELLMLPGNVANGTNRIGVFFQTSMGALAFHRNGKLDISRGWLYLIPTIVGAIVGVLVAVWVSNEQFRIVFRFFMVVMLFVILFKPSRWLRASDQNFRLSPWLAIPVFFIIGFYGGFIQMGMGIFFLAVMVLLARYDIIESNALKLFVVGVYTVLAIAIFQWKGLIDWPIGLIMAIGQGLGGWLMARYAAKNPGMDVWAYRLLVVVVIVALVMLFDIPGMLF